MSKTLLQKAKETKHKRIREITKEHIDLALAWASDEITYTQAQAAMNEQGTGSHTYIILARALKSHYQAVAESEARIGGQLTSALLP